MVFIENCVHYIFINFRYYSKEVDYIYIITKLIGCYACETNQVRWFYGSLASASLSAL